MSNKVFGIVVAVLAIGVIGIALLVSNNNDTSNQSNTGETNEVLSINERDYVKGQTDSSLDTEPVVTVIEYGDFQCPACGAVYPAVKEAVENYADDDRVKFVFRHFPLTAIHPNAMITHRAAEAAGKQGQFYAMHDLLYENQLVWSQSDNATEIVRGYAQQLELNMEQFDQDFADSATLKTITAQLEGGQEVGVTGTPTFFVNDTQVEQNPRTAGELISLIEAELAAADSPETE